jgi:hypothetical protein
MCKKDRDCRAKEREYHRQVLRDLKAQRDKCIAGCNYREGSGQGGR